MYSAPLLLWQQQPMLWEHAEDPGSRVGMWEKTAGTREIRTDFCTRNYAPRTCSPASAGNSRIQFSYMRGNRTENCFVAKFVAHGRDSRKCGKLLWTISSKICSAYARIQITGDLVYYFVHLVHHLVKLLPLFLPCLTDNNIHAKEFLKI